MKQVCCTEERRQPVRMTDGRRATEKDKKKDKEKDKKKDKEKDKEKDKKDGFKKKDRFRRRGENQWM